MNSSLLYFNWIVYDANNKINNNNDYNQNKNDDNNNYNNDIITNLFISTVAGIKCLCGGRKMSHCTSSLLQLSILSGLSGS